VKESKRKKRNTTKEAAARSKENMNIMQDLEMIWPASKKIELFTPFITSSKMLRLPTASEQKMDDYVFK
jgi:hypothetical protein